MALSACSSVNIQDEEFCANLPDGSATCVHLFSADARDIPKAQWDLERVGEITISGQAVADIKSELEKLCHVTGKCTNSTKQTMKVFFQKVEAISRR